MLKSLSEKDKVNMTPEFRGGDTQANIALQLLQRRLAMGAIPENDRNSRTIDAIKRGNLDKFTSIEIAFIEDERFLKDLEKNISFSSPLELSAKALSALVSSIQQEVLNYKPDLFIAFHDYTFGMTLVTSRLIVAAATDSNLQPQLLSSIGQVSQMTNVNPSLIHKESNDQTQKDRQRLERDPSGFSLVDFIIKSQKRNSFPPLVPKFVMAGTEAAGTFYKKIYPIAEQVLKLKA